MTRRRPKGQKSRPGYKAGCPLIQKARIPSNQSSIRRVFARAERSIQGQLPLTDNAVKSDTDHTATKAKNPVNNCTSVATCDYMTNSDQLTNLRYPGRLIEVASAVGIRSMPLIE